MLFQIAGFNEMFTYLQDLGFMDVILPFALIFAIVFAILQQLRIFKNDKTEDIPDPEHPDKTIKGFKANKRINSIIAIAIAALMVVPHVLAPSSTDLVSIINTSLPGVGFILVTLVLVFIISGVLGKKVGTDKPMEGGWQTWVALALMGIIILIALYPNLAGYPFLQFLGDPALQVIILVLAVFGIIVYFVTKD